MRSIVALLLVAACGGPTQSQLAETPAARSRARPAEAPPASTSDRDRTGMTQSFDDMETTQRAYSEANGGTKAPPAAQPPAGAGSGSAAPKKKGVAEQATLPPKSK
jgi:hypothetical protein